MLCGGRQGRGSAGSTALRWLGLPLGKGAPLGSEVQLAMTPVLLCWKHSGLCTSEQPHSTC